MTIIKISKDNIFRYDIYTKQGITDDLMAPITDGHQNVFKGSRAFILKKILRTLEILKL